MQSSKFPAASMDTIRGVGSNYVLQGPPIQVVGVALTTEFCDHNYSFVKVIFL